MNDSDYLPHFFRFGELEMLQYFHGLFFSAHYQRLKQFYCSSHAHSHAHSHT
ncbi:MAG: hypothetical protein RIE73_08930 [Coleofasciculus sp. C1-SOL-03]|uniref:hypothetical protein n=1 Tax=Coleofasciculus sp. C1-SOL-03 TaxID=3069522 RepID=UPI00330421AE